MNPIIIINNSSFYRFILPIVPFGSIGAMIVATMFDFKLLIDVLLGLVIGFFISEILYHFYKNELYFFNDRLEKRTGNIVKKTILYADIELVKYSRAFNLSIGTFGYGPSTKYLELDVRNEKEYQNIQFEPLGIKRKMKSVLKLLGEKQVKLNDGAENFIK